MPPYRNPPVAGPIKQIKKFDIMSEYRGKRMSPDELISRHVPVQALSPLDPTSYRILTASQMDKMQLQKMESRKAGAKTNTVYANPMQHLDYQIYEDVVQDDHHGCPDGHAGQIRDGGRIQTRTRSDTPLG